jgi:hypothetical protein
MAAAKALHPDIMGAKMALKTTLQFLMQEQQEQTRGLARLSAVVVTWCLQVPAVQAAAQTQLRLLQALMVASPVVGQAVEDRPSRAALQQQAAQEAMALSLSLVNEQHFSNQSRKVHIRLRHMDQRTMGAGYSLGADWGRRVSGRRG